MDAVVDPTRPTHTATRSSWPTSSPCSTRRRPIVPSSSACATGRSGRCSWRSVHPDRVLGLIAFEPGVPFIAPRHQHYVEAFARWDDEIPEPAGWEQCNRRVLANRQWPAFADFFFHQLLPEPHSTKQPRRRRGVGARHDRRHHGQGRRLGGAGAGTHRGHGGRDVSQHQVPRARRARRRRHVPTGGARAGARRADRRRARRAGRCRSLPHGARAGPIEPDRQGLRRSMEEPDHEADNVDEGDVTAPASAVPLVADRARPRPARRRHRQGAGHATPRPPGRLAGPGPGHESAGSGGRACPPGEPVAGE